MTQAPRTEIAAIVARLRRHARRATIERGYQSVYTDMTRNALAVHLRERATAIEDLGVVSASVLNLITTLDEVNPCKKSRAKRF